MDYKHRKLAIGDRVEFRSGGFARVLDPGSGRRKPLLRFSGGLKRRVPTTFYHYAPSPCEIRASRDKIFAKWTSLEKRQRRVGVHRPKAVVPVVSSDLFTNELLEVS